MELLTVGLSHQTAPVTLREKAALNRSTSVRLLGDAIAGGAHEAVVLFTCNRTELYATAVDAPGSAEHLVESLGACTSITPDELAATGYVLHNDAAAAHLFRVASSLDSAMVGETEIQGQVRHAWEFAAEHDCVGPMLNQLFRQALEVGKQVRSQTAIGAGAASIPAVAVKAAVSMLDGIAEPSALVVGAGRMGNSTVQHLVEHDFPDIAVANRTLATAQKLAAPLGARTATIDDLLGELTTADVVISATDGPQPTLGPANINQAMKSRPERPLVIIDLSVPRSVAREVGKIRNVMLQDISDLEHISQAALEGRRSEAAKAEALIPPAVQRFRSWHAARRAAPAITSLRDHAEQIRRSELEGIDGQWDHLSSADHERLNALTKRLVNKLLHEPTVRSRNAAEAGDPHDHLASLMYLFGLATEHSHYPRTNPIDHSNAARHYSDPATFTGHDRSHLPA